ncbi:hypothetical protein MJG53_007549 [Ovis ammon polii x Ovis aries]|uniref:Uncharacterized protein n=1 Tax=Ovis ammon polii x Ovis aries TaxID=2918886 RepID=A0ACB9V2Y6_9CETA|nr:hypothetical protein MJG53_007549 [Ovis ammon polii x Ovis aries]
MIPWGYLSPIRQLLCASRNSNGSLEPLARKQAQNGDAENLDEKRDNKSPQKCFTGRRSKRKSVSSLRAYGPIEETILRYVASLETTRLYVTKYWIKCRYSPFLRSDRFQNKVLSDNVTPGGVPGALAFASPSYIVEHLPGLTLHQYINEENRQQNTTQQKQPHCPQRAYVLGGQSHKSRGPPPPMPTAAPGSTSETGRGGSLAHLLLARAKARASLRQLLPATVASEALCSTSLPTSIQRTRAEVMEEDNGRVGKLCG